MSVVSLWEDKLARLEHVAAVQRDYSVNPLLGAVLAASPRVLLPSCLAPHCVVSPPGPCEPRSQSHSRACIVSFSS
jgi:hypothetical protein